MKSPWKLLGQLITRRQISSPDVGDERPQPDVQTPTAVVQPASIALPDLPTEANGPSVSADRHEDLSGSREPDVRRVRPIERKTRTAGSGSPKSLPVSPVKAKDRVSTAQAIGSDTIQQPANTLERSLTSGMETTFNSEAAELDEEIKQLRQQLTEKLRKQNDQLRAMYARFERGDGT